MAEERDYSAKHALLDPFTDPEPSQETGPGTHFRSTFDRPTPEPSPPAYQDGFGKSVPVQTTGSSTETNPFRRKHVSHASSHSRKGSAQTSVRESVTDHGQLTPPSSTSPRQTQFPSSHRAEAFGAHRDEPPRSSKSPMHTRNRSTSLNERYPGDKSNQPLEILRKESRKARRAPHLHKKHLPGPDTIDRLDLAGFSSYHHEGPYDAALTARNTSWKNSPIAALQHGNEETLRATPKEAIRDSVVRHRPLDGVAFVPSGHEDRFGRKYDYEEGPNLMIEGGYKRWPGIEYKDEDIKGKGEPSYTIEKALKQHKMEANDAEYAGIEMQTRPRNKSTSYASANDTQPGLGRSHSTGKNHGGLKKRFGSLRRRKGSH